MECGEQESNRGESQEARNAAGAPEEKVGGSRLWWYGFCLLLAVTTYFYGLDGLHIPRNGDELMYAHITRLTAKSGHLLPLKTEWPQIRNTKPPLLFWQGILMTRWGRDWRLEMLRVPSVLYTLLTATLLFLLGRRESGELEKGALASLVYLAFFNTYRYGRPFLTDPPLTFWMFLPLFVLLYGRPRTFESRWGIPALLGFALGIGFLYKSFALAVPVLVTLALWYLDHRQWQAGPFLRKDGLKLVLIAGISFAVFGLWFVLDPQPLAVVREFVMGENLGRFDAQGGGYLKRLLWGGSSLWSLALGFFVNAGLLVFPVAGLCGVAYKRRKQWSAGERLLWIWVVTLFVAFSLPSVRSARYLLPAMPAVAVLSALNWERISRKAFVATLIAAGLPIAVMVYFSVRLEANLPETRMYPVQYWLLLGSSAALVVGAVTNPKITRACAPAVALLVCLSLAAFLRPLDGPLGHYRRETQAALNGKEIWVPSDFLAVGENYQFLLPGANIREYRADGTQTLEDLGKRYRRFAARLPVTARPREGIRVLDQRLDLRSRLTAREQRALLGGNLFDTLFVREVIAEVPEAPGEVPGEAHGVPAAATGSSEH